MDFRIKSFNADIAAQADSNPKVPKRSADLKENKVAAKKFEQYFVSHMMKTIQKSIQKSELFNRGMSEDIYYEMFLDEVAKKAADNGGFGLADSIEKSLNQSPIPQTEPENNIKKIE